MDQCSHFLVILSAAAIQSKWVRREIELARSRQSKDAGFRVLPIVVGKLEDYPESEYIKSLQQVPYHDDFHAQVETVATALGLRPPIPEEIATFIEERQRDFVGRDYVFEAIDQFLQANRNGYFILDAYPVAG